MTNTPVSDCISESDNNSTKMQYVQEIIKNKLSPPNGVNGYRKTIVTYTIATFQVADSIDIDAFKRGASDELIGTDLDELLFRISDDRFISVHKYGVVSFFNCDIEKTYEFIKQVSAHAKNIYGFLLEEEFILEAHALDIRFGFNKIEIMEPEIEILRLIMLNCAQSVAISHYLQQTKLLLERTTRHISTLGKAGRLGISGMDLKKFIAVTLNLKNEIVENLYILDSPQAACEDETLLKIDVGMKKILRMQHKSGSVHDHLKIVTEHLELFSNMMHHSSSIKMEWIIIALVFIEVVNTMLSHIF